MKKDRIEQFLQQSYSLHESQDDWMQGLSELLAPEVKDDAPLFWLTYWHEEHHVQVDGFSGRAPDWAIVRTLLAVGPREARDRLVSSPGMWISSEVFPETIMKSLAFVMGRRPDGWSFAAPDACGYGVGFGAPRTNVRPVSGRRRALYGRLMNHVGAGLRLRRAVAEEMQHEAPELVLSPDGQCLHAEGLGRPTAWRRRVQDAVRHREQQRSCGEDDETLWSGLVAGRWSFVDRFEENGRRYVVAYRNPQGVLDPRRCTPSEREVLRLASHGLSNDEIAADVGVSSSTVGVQVSQGLRKLGLRSRAELPMFYRTAFRRTAPLRVNSKICFVSESSREPAWLLSLTQAERFIALRLASGAKNEEIAKERGSTKNTVANQIASLFSKLRVTSRHQLAARLAGTRAKGEFHRS